MKNTLIINLLVTALVPFLAHAQAIAPLKENQMYSIVSVSPDTRGDEKLQGVSAKIKEKLSSIGDQVIKIAGQGLVQPKTMHSAFANLGTSVRDELKPFAIEINKDLPEDSVVFSVYIMPYGKVEEAKLKSLPVVGDVQVVEKDLGVMAEARKANVFEFYANLHAQIAEIAKVKSDKFQFAAVAAHIKLSRGYIEVKFQMLGELKAGSTEFAKANKQVIINELEILSDEANNLRPMALLEVLQQIPTKETQELGLPQVRIDFGAFGGISGGYGTRWAGQLQILDDAVTGANTCDVKFNSVPSLFGFFAEEATGILFIDKYLQNKPVRFRIMWLTVDAETLRVKNMKLATQIGVFSADPSELAAEAKKGKIFNCLDVKSVGEQFTSEANVAVEDALKEITSQTDATPELMNALYE